MPSPLKEAVLELESRRKIYNIIESSPGLHFRELQRRAEAAYGSLQYHIEYLIKKGLVIEKKEDDYSRYFSKDFESTMEREVMALLRQKTVRRILMFFIEKPNSRNKDVSKYLNISPSTASWHIHRLLKSGSLSQQTVEGEKSFFLTDADMISRLLITYKSTFMDTIVDRFVEVWEKENIKNIRKNKI